MAERLSSAPKALVEAARAIELPSVELPLPKLGDVALHDVQLPDVTLPRPKWGAVTMQDVQLPDITLPRPRMAEIKLQDVQLPGVTLPRPRLGELQTRDVAIRGPRISGPAHRVRRLIQLAVLAVAGTAIFQEMSQPEDQRQWHGHALGVPYDFRPPTSERLRAAWWNQKAGLITPAPWGVGWTINFRRSLTMLQAALDGRRQRKDARPSTRMEAEAASDVTSNKQRRSRCL